MNPNENSIQTYYDRLAPEYDQDRFANSYGQYLHAQEERILQQYFLQNPENQILSLACGTGRFMEYAAIGVDISSEMLKVAQQKFPTKRFILSDASQLTLAENSLHGAFSWHFFMHLDKEKVAEIIEKAHFSLKKGGVFVFDVPSAHRRKFLSVKTNNWHGANSYELHEIAQLAGEKWKIQAIYGILFFPIHRFPRFFRPFLLALDNLFCRSLLKKFASYLTIVFEKS